jgi:hypothetical protein
MTEADVRPWVGGVAVLMFGYAAFFGWCLPAAIVPAQNDYDLLAAETERPMRELLDMPFQTLLKPRAFGVADLRPQPGHVSGSFKLDPQLEVHGWQGRYDIHLGNSKEIVITITLQHRDQLLTLSTSRTD